MDLEILQEPDFQRREWRLERVGWTLLTLFVLAGLLGLVGPGPLGDTTRAGEGGLVEVSYGRVAHYEADDLLSIRFDPAAVEQDTVTLALTGSWVSGVDLQGVTPAPSEERVTDDGVVYEFAVEEPGDLTVTVSFRAQDVGPLTADVAVGTDSLSLTQLILP
ncbi:hypothetical protein L1785_15815 [Antribacter sp. KLBMP9083]|uniref:Uncharacterized protein n=1 Tax=Antribacter soli TaxID=2910976 RepID=A0AA41U8I2_9MICO|nr:hypothetical protein [Antribacter soli]MCF4122445.1 hypothetical protein [Antribacter soli]